MDQLSIIKEYAKRHDGQTVDVYLVSGIKLVGYIVKACENELLFRSAIDQKEGVIMYSAVASIFPNAQGKTQERTQTDGRRMIHIKS